MTSSLAVRRIVPAENHVGHRLDFGGWSQVLQKVMKENQQRCDSTCDEPEEWSCRQVSACDRATDQSTEYGTQQSCGVKSQGQVPSKTLRGRGKVVG